MPPVEVTAFGDQAITATWRQPIQRAYIGRRQSDAVWNLFGTVLIILAGAKACIEKFAGNVSEIDFAGVFVLELFKATTGTAIAEAFPFRLRHLFQRLGFPEESLLSGRRLGLFSHGLEVFGRFSHVSF